MRHIITSMFQGMMPMLNNTLLGSHASNAVDCDFLSGALRPLRRNTFVQSKTSDHKGLIVFGNNEYLTIPGPSPYIETPERVIYHDGSKPKYYDRIQETSFEFGTLPYLDEDWKTDTSASITPTLTAGATADANDTLYTYAISLVNDHGDESGFSKFASAQAPADSHITISATAAQIDFMRPLLTGHDQANIQIRIYRSTTGGFLLVGTVPFPAANGAFSHQDDLEEVGTLLRRFPSENVALPDTARGFIQHPNNFIICHDDHNIYLSDPLAYAQFPESYRIVLPEIILGIQEYLGRLIIFLQERPHRVLEISVPGAANTALTSPESSYGCSSRNGITKLASGVLFASRDGLCMTDGYATNLISPTLFDEVSFSEHDPRTIRLQGGGDDFLMESAQGVFLFQRGGHMTALSDDLDDAIWWEGKWHFLLADESRKMIVIGFGSLHPRTMTWESGDYTMSQPTALNSVFVYGTFLEEIIGSIGGLGLTGPLGMSLEGIGSSGTSSILLSEQNYIELSVKNSKSEYSLKNRFLDTQVCNFQGGQSRQSRVYSYKVRGNALINQIAFASHPRMFASIAHPVQQQ